jgi:hypothetical protein
MGDNPPLKFLENVTNLGLQNVPLLNTLLELSPLEVL